MGEKLQVYTSSRFILRILLLLIAPECPTPLKRKRRAESLLQVTQTLSKKLRLFIHQFCSVVIRFNIATYFL